MPESSKLIHNWSWAITRITDYFCEDFSNMIINDDEDEDEHEDEDEDEDDDDDDDKQWALHLFKIEPVQFFTTLRVLPSQLPWHCHSYPRARPCPWTPPPLQLSPECSKKVMGFPRYGSNHFMSTKRNLKDANIKPRHLSPKKTKSCNKIPPIEFMGRFEFDFRLEILGMIDKLYGFSRSLREENPGACNLWSWVSANEGLFPPYCWCFRNPANHLGCIKPCK